MVKVRLGCVLPIENASSFCEEAEPLQEGHERLKHIATSVRKTLYISLTWGMENRFGGGQSYKCWPLKRMVKRLFGKKMQDYFFCN